MKKRNKSPFIIFSLVTVCAFYWLYSNQADKVTKSKDVVKPTPTAFSKPVLHPKKPKPAQTKKNSRSVASIPTKQQKRTIIGTQNHMSVPSASNKISKDWKQKYINSFKRMVTTKTLTNFKVDVQKSMILVKPNNAINVEHVIVSYKTPGGTPYSFEAYINSETGQMVQSWNKTRLEIRRSVKLSPAGKEFKPTI